MGLSIDHGTLLEASTATLGKTHGLANRRVCLDVSCLILSLWSTIPGLEPGRQRQRVG